MTDEEIELERQDGEETMKLLETRIASSGLFRIDRIPDLLAKLRAGYTPFARVNTKVAFDGDVLLTVKEKKELELNARMKYSKNYIEYFDPKALRKIEPKATLENMHLDAFHRVSQKRELIKLRELNFVKQVRIVSSEDARDCAKVKRFKKIHPIDEAPELPLPGCTAAYCRCMYLAVIPKDL